MKICYCCDAAGSTKEHVPPKSFFPPSLRKNLITVPSCEAHNLDNSEDVEIARSQICQHIQTNGVARSLAADKVLRSLQRNNAALAKKTLRNLRPVIVNGQQTGVFTAAIDSINRVMEAIAYAIYFHTKGNRYTGSWQIILSSLVFHQMPAEGSTDGWKAVQEALANLPYTSIPMPEPSVFTCEVYEVSETKVIYRFCFYEGFIVHAATIP